MGQRPRRPRDHRPAQARRLRHDLQPGARQRQHARLRQGEAQPRHLRRPAGVRSGSRRGTPSPMAPRASGPPCPPTPPRSRRSITRDRRPRRDVRDPRRDAAEAATGSAARCRAWSRRRTGRSSASRGWRRPPPRAYAGVGEHGVYVARAARGHGVGRRLLDEAASPRTAGLHKLTSRIFNDNAASIAAHVAAGFDVVGVQRRHARLDGAWKDCVLVERLLGEAAAG